MPPKSKDANRPALAESKGVVVVLDLLGTKGRWQADNPADLIRRLRGFQDRVGKEYGSEMLYRTKLKESGEGWGRISWRSRVLSDTVVVTGSCTRNPDRFIFNEVSEHLLGTFNDAVQSGFLPRGAVSWGTFYQDADALVGPAVDEAALWADEADWAGFILTPGASTWADEVLLDDGNGAPIELRKWEVPLRSGRTFRTWTVWWPKSGDRSGVDDLFCRSPVDVDVARKRENTLAYYDQTVIAQFKAGRA